MVELYLGPRTPPVLALANVLGYLISEPAFSTLRTKEQLGYIVSASNSARYATRWLKVAVQSHTKAPYVLEQRIEAFLSNFTEYLVKMKDADFQVGCKLFWLLEVLCSPRYPLRAFPLPIAFDVVSPTLFPALIRDPLMEFWPTNFVSICCRKRSTR